MMLLTKGDHNDAVEKRQLDLIHLGFGKFLGSAGADGHYGRKTKLAVTRFQQWVGIKVDGIIGNETRNHLEEAKTLAGFRGTFNFNLSEFYSNGVVEPPNGMDNQLLWKLEMLRYRIGNKPLIVTSGYRTKTHNAKVGGVPDSQHLYARASDIKAQGVRTKKLYKLADRVFAQGGVGKYNTFIHVDTRGYHVRF